MKCNKVKPINKEDLYCPHCGENSLQLVNPNLLKVLHDMNRYTNINILSGYLCPQEAKRRGLKDTDSATSGNIAVISWVNNRNLYDLLGAAILSGAKQIYVYENSLRIGVDENRQTGVWFK